jgi:hypothetical protein
MEDYILYKELSDNYIKTYYSPSTAKWKIVDLTNNKVVHTQDETQVDIIIHRLKNQIETEQALKDIKRLVRYR